MNLLKPVIDRGIFKKLGDLANYISEVILAITILPSTNADDDEKIDKLSWGSFCMI